MKKFLPILFFFTLTLTACTRTQSSTPLQDSPPEATTEADIFKNALNLYLQKKAQDVDFSNGPCLGKIAPDWVLDIAHSPRQTIDDKTQNQCADFKEGRVHHFIELDPDGKLIRSN